MYQELQILEQPGQILLGLGLGATALGILGILRINLGMPLVMAIVRSLLQLTVLAIVFSLAVEFSRWGTLIFASLLWLVISQFTWSRLPFPIDRFTVGGILLLAAGLPSLYAVLLVLQPDPFYAPQIWIPILSFSLSSASAIVLQGGNGGWQQWQRQRAEEQVEQQTMGEESGWKLEWESERESEWAAWEAEESNLVQTKAPETKASEETKGKTIALGGAVDTMLYQILRLRVQQIGALGLVSVPLVFAGQLLVGVAPLSALGYEILVLLVSLNSALIAAWGLKRALQ